MIWLNSAFEVFSFGVRVSITGRLHGELSHPNQDIILLIEGAFRDLHKACRILSVGLGRFIALDLNIRPSAIAWPAGSAPALVKRFPEAICLRAVSTDLSVSAIYLETLKPPHYLIHALEPLLSQIDQLAPSPTHIRPSSSSQTANRHIALKLEAKLLKDSLRDFFLTQAESLK